MLGHGSPFTRTIICLLALLTPVQPAVALHCFCCAGVAGPVKQHRGCHCCADGYAVESKSSESLCSEGACGCQGHHEKQRAPSTRASGFAPCRCPQDCSCHLRHGTDVAVLRSSTTATQKGAPCLRSPACPNIYESYPISQLAVDFQQNYSRQEVSALALCAALCRFLI